MPLLSSSNEAVQRPGFYPVLRARKRIPAADASNELNHRTEAAARVRLGTVAQLDVEC
jgi:hypothetical protein